jgi:hypothetical protein
MKIESDLPQKLRLLFVCSSPRATFSRPSVISNSMSSIQVSVAVESSELHLRTVLDVFRFCVLRRADKGKLDLVKLLAFDFCKV